MLKKTAVLLMCSFALASCSNTDNVESTAADDAATDVAVDEGAKTSTVAGSSISDQFTEDGILTDIDEYINGLAVTPTQKAAIKYDATLFQKVLTIDIKDNTQLTGLSQDMANSLNCLSTLFDDMGESMDILSEVERMTFNTGAKVKTYENYSQAQSEVPITMPSGDTCTGF